MNTLVCTVYVFCSRHLIVIDVAGPPRQRDLKV